MLEGSASTFSLILLGGEGGGRDVQVQTKYRMRCINACAFIAVKIPQVVLGLEGVLEADLDYRDAKKTLGIWRFKSEALEREMVRLDEALA